MKPTLWRLGAWTAVALAGLTFWQMRALNLPAPLPQPLTVPSTTSSTHPISPSARLPAQALPPSDATLLTRGAYLARAGNCMDCHTARGGSDYAGGRALHTPFGTFLTPNITPDRETGIGNWSANDFWQALHHGMAPNGRLLYPAFPYPDYTRIRRDDADALFAYLQSLPPVRQPNAPHTLDFPYNQRWLLAGWRLLFFRPGEQIDDTRHSAEWNRGAYLVEGLGHCSACHTPRNALGASLQNAMLGGAMLPDQSWYAPSLAASDEAGLQHWQQDDIATLLKTGVAPQASLSGPMAAITQQSLQYLNDTDLRAMAVYLQSLPTTEMEHAPTDPSDRILTPEDQATLKQGATLYQAQCATCHLPDGRGQQLPGGAGFPALAGNRAVTHLSPLNPIRIVLNGSFAPATTGNPQPHGMPPFGPFLSDQELAAVLSYIRNAWGNQASMVNATTIRKLRSVPVE